MKVCLVSWWFAPKFEQRYRTTQHEWRRENFPPPKPVRRRHVLMFRSPKFTTYRERMVSNVHTATVTSYRVFFWPSPTKNTNMCCLLLSSGAQSSTSLLFVMPWQALLVLHAGVLRVRMSFSLSFSFGPPFFSFSCWSRSCLAVLSTHSKNLHPVDPLHVFSNFSWSMSLSIHHAFSTLSAVESGFSPPSE